MVNALLALTDPAYVIPADERADNIKSSTSDLVQAVLQSEGLSDLPVDRLQRMLNALLNQDSSAVALPTEEIVALLLRMKGINVGGSRPTPLTAGKSPTLSPTFVLPHKSVLR